MTKLFQYNKSEINKVDSCIVHIYKLLLDGSNYINTLDISTDTIINTSCISNLNDDTFLPVDIKEYILTNTNQSITYKTTINGKNIRLSFCTMKRYKSTVSVQQIRAVFSIIYLLSLHASKQCSQQLYINIFLTPFKKELPSNKNETIGATHVNSGLSNSGCNHTSRIIIYREEEWFKVLIHELFHNFHLDFSTRDITKSARELREYCGIQSDYAIYETYCETWARILNCCIHSFITSTSLIKKHMTGLRMKKDYINNFHKLIEVERLFSLKQADLILKQFQRKEDYKEDSNVFCYYILTACLMNDYLSFLMWCHANNPTFIKFKDTSKNLDAFTKLIINKLDVDFNDGIAYVRILNRGDNNKSLRMSKGDIPF